MKKFRKLFLAATSLMVLSACGQKIEVKKNNSLKEVEEDPVLFDNFFEDDRIPDQWYDYGIGDPFMYRFNGIYYLICSTRGTETGVIGWKSTDMYHWQKVSNGVLPDGYLVAKEEDRAFDAWASEVYYLDGKFYLLESRHGEGHYVFESTSPEGPFTCITDGTIDNRIDGSMYMDIDGKMIMINAGGSVMGKVFADDMKSVSEQQAIANTSIVGWTEGPEIMTKDGIRYYFYTGNGVSQYAYRIDYSFGPATEHILDGSKISLAHNVILNTDEEWYGTGHGCVVLGPDLDSYYLGFHNSYRKGNYGGRRFNLGRLLFNGSDVQMQHIGLHNNIMPNLPDYQELDTTKLVSEGDYKFASESTKDSFTVEFNFKGQGKNIFSYKDSNNYGYAAFDGSKITIHRVENGNDSTVATVNTLRTFRTDVLHAIRLGYKDGLMDVSFDLQEIANDVNVGNFTGGKVGYLGYDEIGALTFNNTAQGDSDKETPKQENVPATSYSIDKSKLSEKSKVQKTRDSISNKLIDETYELVLGQGGDYATYLDYACEEGTYGLDMVLRSDYYGKTVGVQIDGGDIVKWKIPDYSNEMYEGYVRLKVADIYLTKGNHNITIYNLGDTIAYQNIYIERNYPIKGTKYEESLHKYPEKGVNYPTFMNLDERGFYSENSSRYLVTFGDGGLEDVSISVDIIFSGINGTGTCGLVIAANKWAFNNIDLDNYKSIRGYYYAMNLDQIQIIDSDYQYSDESCMDTVLFDNGETINLKAVKIGKSLTMYINGNEVLHTFSPLGHTRGYVGIYANWVEAAYTNLKIETL